MANAHKIKEGDTVRCYLPVTIKVKQGTVIATEPKKERVKC